MAENPLVGVSGPSSFSKRTDLPSEFYGDDVNKIKAGAPLAKTSDVNPTSLSEQGMAPSQLARVTPLFAPSERKDEDIMAGAPMGPGPGSEALGISRVAQKTSDALAKMIPFDTTGEITILYQQALARGD